MNRSVSGSDLVGRSATNCLNHRGENDLTAPGNPGLTALIGDTATPRPAAASCGAAVVTDVLITGSGRTPASASDRSSHALRPLSGAKCTSGAPSRSATRT